MFKESTSIGQILLMPIPINRYIPIVNSYSLSADFIFAQVILFASFLISDLFFLYQIKAFAYFPFYTRKPAIKRRSGFTKQNSIETEYK